MLQLSPWRPQLKTRRNVLTQATEDSTNIKPTIPEFADVVIIGKINITIEI